MKPVAAPRVNCPALAARCATRLATASATLLALAACATTDRTAVVTPVPLAADGEFCVAAQALITGSKVPAANAVYTDCPAFVESRLEKAEPRSKGTRYCHFVAPEYLKRALLGDAWNSRRGIPWRMRRRCSRWRTSRSDY